MSATVTEVVAERALKGPVFSLAVNDEFVAAGHHNGLIDVYSHRAESASNGTVVVPMELAAHTGTIRQLHFAQDPKTSQQFLFSCSSDGNVKCWTVPDFQWKMTYTGHECPVESLVVNFSSGTLYSGGLDGSLRHWRIEDGECLKVLKCHAGKISALCIPKAPQPREGEEAAVVMEEPPRPNTILTASDDTLAKLIDPATKLVHVVLRGEKPILCMTYVHPAVYLGCADGAIRGFHIHTAQPVALLRGHTDGVNAMLAFEGRWLLSVSDDVTVKMWLLKSWQANYNFSGHSRCVTSIAAHAESGHVYTAGFDGIVKCWNAGKIHSLVVAAEEAAAAAAAAQKKKSEPPPQTQKKK